MQGTIVIVGASARAAAFSALRAGWEPWCADLFADADLVRRCTAGTVDSYGLDLLERAPLAPWTYTGALENWPHLVDLWAAARQLCGNTAAVLAETRDPQAVAQALSKAGLFAADCVRRPDGLPVDGSWLRKPRRSAGGRGIVPWDEVAAAERRREPVYFQKLVQGMPCAAAYVASAGRARLLGVTEQLLGRNKSGHPFGYRGSIGPLRLSGSIYRQFVRIGQTLAARFGLCGVFGVDAIVSGREVTVVEVNPRYTASMEILERAGSPSIVGMHLAACLAGRLPPVAAGNDGEVHGKWIVFADRALEVGDGFTHEMLRTNTGRGLPAVADIPRAGAKIEAGEPIVTVFARGTTREAVVRELEQRRAAVQRKIVRECAASS